VAKQLVASQRLTQLHEISLWYLRAHYCGHTSSSWLCILRKTDPVQTLPNYFFKIYLKASFHLHLGFPSSLFLSGFLCRSLHVFLTLACVLHDLPTSLSYIIYQTVIMSTTKCKKVPTWIMQTNRSL
jgi:hypothetical protein